MRRSALVVGLALGILTAAGSASAADETGGIASQGQFIVSVDRVFSLISYQDFKQGPDANNSSTSTTNFGLITSHPAPPTLFAVPRFALDYTVTSNITVGGSLFLLATLGSTGTTTVDSKSTSSPAPKLTYLGIAPRVGYILPITETFAFWGRLGFTYAAGTTSTTTTQANGTTTSTSATTSEFALDVEPMFVFSPVSHFGFTFGPTIDIPLTGSLSSGGQSVDSSQFYVGLQTGILGYF